MCAQRPKTSLVPPDRVRDAFFQPPIHRNDGDSIPSHPDRYRTHGPQPYNAPDPLSTLLGTPVGRLVTFAVKRQQFKHQLQALQQQYKTEFMAEKTARHFLNHKSFTKPFF